MLQSVVFPFDHGYSYNDNALKFIEDEENDWHSLQFKDYITCDNALKVCGVLSVNQVLDQQLIRPEVVKYEEEMVEDTVTFLYALKRSQLAGKYM